MVFFYRAPSDNLVVHLEKNDEFGNREFINLIDGAENGRHDASLQKVGDEHLPLTSFINPSDCPNRLCYLHNGVWPGG